MTARRPARMLRAALRLLLFVVVALAFAGLYVLSAPWPRRHRLRVQQWWCGACAIVAGLRVRALGPRMEATRPIIYLVNHVSYFDIPAFGQLAAATFVAKSEVAHWPVFGWFARLTGTIFIPRRSTRSAEQVALLKQRLARGESLILFPEGTNSDGSDVLPFKSSLLESVAADAAAARAIVQPVSLAYVRLRSGEPLTGSRRGLYAWVDADDMFPHLWRALGAVGADVRVLFHPPLPPENCVDRKRIAHAAHRAVRDGLCELWSTS